MKLRISTANTWHIHRHKYCNLHPVHARFTAGITRLFFCLFSFVFFCLLLLSFLLSFSSSSSFSVSRTNDVHLWLNDTNRTQVEWKFSTEFRRKYNCRSPKTTTKTRKYSLPSFFFQFFFYTEKCQDREKLQLKAVIRTELNVTDTGVVLVITGF